MTTSIPTTNSIPASGAASPGAQVDSFLSSQGQSSQDGRSGTGGSDFGALLDSSSRNDGTPRDPGATQANAGAPADATDAGKADVEAASGQAKPADGRAEVKRDVSEAIASMLSAGLLPAPGPIPALVPALDSGAPGASVPATGAEATPVIGTSPAATTASAAGLSQLYGRLSAALVAESGVKGPVASALDKGAVAAEDRGGVEGEPTGSPPASPGGVVAALLEGPQKGAENIAAAGAIPPGAQSLPKGAFKKNFLVPNKQMVTATNQTSGIGSAKTLATMPIPFSLSRQMADTTGTAAGSPVSAVIQAGTASQQAPAALPAAPVSPTLAPVLAQRAVETVLNVVDAQQVTSSQSGTVKLDFTFGGEALAVHVQMKGGEVHTEFRTNSPELRSALSSEWQAAAGHRDAEGLRLAEPVFSSGNGGSSTSGGSSNAEGFAFQQQNSRQQSPASPDATFLRSSRPAAAIDDGASDLSSPAPSVANRTSLHLAAVA